MQSRMEKYYKDDLQEYSRSKKNSDLYKKVYGSYAEMEHLPVSDNVSEIDLNHLKKIVTSREEYQKNKQASTIGAIKLEEAKEEVVEQPSEKKIYDINELIEQARSRSRYKKEEHKVTSPSYNFLKSLQSEELTIDEIKKASQKQEMNKLDDKKYNTKPISEDPNIKKITPNKNNTSLSLELLSDLKPTGDTVVVEPMGEKDTMNDIPIETSINSTKLEKQTTEELERSKISFYSGSYTFSKKDFTDDDFEDGKKSNSILKIFLLILIIAICITAIYFLVSFLGTR